MSDKEILEHVCLLKNEHEAHDWWYTSSGGGHMLSEYDASGREKNQKQWHCPGLSEDDISRKEALDHVIKPLFDQHYMVVRGVRQLIKDLDDARASGEIYTYGEIQRRLHLCLDSNYSECAHTYRVFREFSGGTCIKCTECGEVLSRDGN